MFGPTKKCNIQSGSPEGTTQFQDMLVEKKISHTVCDLTGLATESELLSKFIIQLTHIFVKCPNSVY